MPNIEFECLPTMIGSMPQKDPVRACEQVLRYLKQAPAWPQLPCRGFKENMYVQFSRDFPGVVIEDQRIFVDKSGNLDKPLEALYSAYLENKIDTYPLTEDYASGFFAFLRQDFPPVTAVKGQVTGPVSWGLTVADSSGRAIAYDEILCDAAARLLRLRAAWMETELRTISSHTMIFVDEPSLHSIGSAFFALSPEKVISLLAEVLSGIQGLKGIHCCGNTDWSIVLRAAPDILSFDTYNYPQSIALYSKEIAGFVERGGTIAWGIIPNLKDDLGKETIASLQDRLEEAMAPLTRKGMEIPFRRLVRQSLLTPSCTLATLTEESSGLALEMLVDLSTRMRSKYR